MRLIDADYFKEQVAAATLKSNIEPKKGTALLDLIDSIPSACDIDKVVHILNTEAERFEDSGKAYECDKELGIAEGFKQAAEYVKDGGKSYHTTANP